MSAIVALRGGDAGLPPAVDAAARALRAMRGRGASRRFTWCGAGATLGVARHEWEMVAGLAGDALVATDGDLVVAADAALYHVADLRARLAAAGALPAGDAPGFLIAAAYRAWGTRCAAELEGDFAFALWDARHRRLTCARDFAGRRPLHWARLDDGSVAVASLAAGLLAHPRCSADIDVAALAIAAAGLLNRDVPTGFTAVQSLAAGHTLIVHDDGATAIERHWEPPVFERGDGPPFAEAAAELRRLIVDAASERLAPSGPTTVWLSGGWDSTAVFAGAGLALGAPGARHDGRCVLPVSFSYPPGDPGREDELIAAVCERWHATPAWLDAHQVPLFGDARRRAARRDALAAHPYEGWNRALMAAAAAQGSRVALDGSGGDQLFQVSPIYLADLAAAGRLATLAREWRAGPVADGGLAGLLHWAVYPALPDAVCAAAARAMPRRLRPRHYMRRQLPPWMARGASRLPGVAAHAVPDESRRPGESLGSRESAWYFTGGWLPTCLSLLSNAALEHGLEVRSPLSDARVVRFAAARPREERASGGETKRLLRAAMHGLLPDQVLAPRARRTGVTGGYMRQALARELPALLASGFVPTALADLGVVDAAAFRRAAEACARRPEAWYAGALCFTIGAELWLRARLPARSPAAGRASPFAAAT